MNITEKILARAASLKEVQPGEIIEAQVDLAMIKRPKLRMDRGMNSIAMA